MSQQQMQSDLVEPPAGGFYRAAMMALHHAHDHMSRDGAVDAVQVVLSVDFAVEMLLKAVLLNEGQSIVERSGRTVDLRTALAKSGHFRYGPHIEILHERRNSLQHFAAYMDKETAREMYEGALKFVEEVLEKRLAFAFPEELRRVE